MCMYSLGTVKLEYPLKNHNMHTSSVNSNLFVLIIKKIISNY